MDREGKCLGSSRGDADAVTMYREADGGESALVGRANVVESFVSKRFPSFLSLATPSLSLWS